MELKKLKNFLDEYLKNELFFLLEKERKHSEKKEKVNLRKI